MPEPLKVALIGVGGGVGKVHLASMQGLEKRGLVKLVAVAENNIEKNKATLEALIDKGVKVDCDWRLMVDSTAIDALTVSAPHHYHVPMSTYSLEKGIHVFCEKPPAVTIASGERFVRAMKKNQRVVGVNYMYTAADSARLLKELILKGGLGRIEKIIAKGLWARSNEYYKATPWRGKFSLDGQPVRDGCLFNQFPHLLNQCIYFVSGDGVPSVTKVKAELYRAHNKKYTQMEDTVSLNARVNDVDILLYCTVCHTIDEDLTLEIIGEKGKAKWSYLGFSVKYNDGRKDGKLFQHETQGTMCLKMYEDFINKVLGNKTDLIWNLKQALVLTNIVSQAHKSGIQQIPTNYAPEKLVEKKGTTAGSIRQAGDEYAPAIIGIKDIITEAAEKGKMFSEMGVPWAKVLHKYRH